MLRSQSDTTLSEFMGNGLPEKQRMTKVFHRTRICELFENYYALSVHMQENFLIYSVAYTAQNIKFSMNSLMTRTVII